MSVLLRLLSRAAAIVLLGLSLVPTAQAQTFQRLTVSFNDLGASQYGDHLPAGYAGFNWGMQWFYMSSTDALRGNYLATGTAQTGTLIQRVDRSPFYFDGATFWSRRGLDANGSFYLVMYLNGQTVFNGTLSSKNRMRFTGTPTFLASRYKGLVDGVAFVFHKDDYDHFAADDFRFRVAAP